MKPKLTLSSDLFTRCKNNYFGGNIKFEQVRLGRAGSVTSYNQFDHYDDVE